VGGRSVGRMDWTTSLGDQVDVHWVTADSLEEALLDPGRQRAQDLGFGGELLDAAQLELQRVVPGLDDRDWLILDQQRPRHDHRLLPLVRCRHDVHPEHVVAAGRAVVGRELPLDGLAPGPGCLPAGTPSAPDELILESGPGPCR
jgi:hypothetical protein